MKTLTITEFKAKCIALLKEVERTQKPLVVTLRGKPIARVSPPEAPTRKLRKLGGQSNVTHIQGDIVHADWSADWDQP